MIVPLANPLVTLLEEAAQRASLRQAPIGVEDLMMALLNTVPLGMRLAAALYAPQHWKALTEPAVSTEQAIWTEEHAVPFDTQSQRLFLDGASAVLLGPYEPRHLAEAIGGAAELHPERFTRFGFEARAWRQALRVRIEDH